jgi:hypothetical protein
MYLGLELIVVGCYNCERFWKTKVYCYSMVLDVYM